MHLHGLLTACLTLTCECVRCVQLMANFNVVRDLAANTLRFEAEKRRSGEAAAYDMHMDSGEAHMRALLACFFDKASIPHLLHVASKSSASELLVFDCHMGLLCTVPGHMLLLFRNPNHGGGHLGLDVMGIDTATRKICLMRRDLLAHATHEAYSGASDMSLALAIAASPINVVLTKGPIVGKGFGWHQLDTMKSAVTHDTNKHLLRPVTPHTLVALVTSTCGYSVDSAHRLVHTLDNYGQLDSVSVAMLHVTLDESAWDLLCLVLPASQSERCVLKCLDDSGQVYTYLPTVDSKVGPLFGETTDGRELYNNPSFMGLIGQTARDSGKVKEKRVVVAMGKSAEGAFVWTVTTPDLAEKYLRLAPCPVPAKLAGSNSLHAALFGAQQ